MTTPAKPTTAVTTTKPDDKAVEFVPFGASDKVRLTASMVRQFIAVPTRSGALPSERDCIRFIMLCRGKRGNPFEGDIFLIGYDTKNGPSFSMVCGVELFLKRAEQSEYYDGNESGVIVATADNAITERAGAIVLKGETLVGGWARVHRKDKSHPEYKSVLFETYNTGYSRWEKDPCGMIAKVALSQALRSAYPTALGGLYTQEEMQRLTEVGQGMITAQEPIQQPKAIDDAKQTPADDGEGTDLAPAKNPVPGPHPPAEPPVNDTVQQQLARFMSDAGVSFDDLRSWLATNEMIKDVESVGSFDELPTAVCEKLQKNAKAMSAIVRTFGEKKT